MEGPIDGHSTPTTPGERVIDKPELPARGLYTDNTVRVEMVEGALQLKRGVAGEYEIFCDEGAQIGGTARYPTPMAYLAMATGF